MLDAAGMAVGVAAVGSEGAESGRSADGHDEHDEQGKAREAGAAFHDEGPAWAAGVHGQGAAADAPVPLPAAWEGVPAWADGPVDTTAPTAAWAPVLAGRVVEADGSSQTEVVFVDASVPDRQTLIDGVRDGAEVVLLSTDRPALIQMAEHLAGRADLDAIHVVSHGRTGALAFGAGTVDVETLQDHTGSLAVIGQALAADGDLLLYGCSVGADGSGAAFVEAMARATGADVAASDDPTGAAARGGDWMLEHASGRIEAATAIGVEAQAAYAGLLESGFELSKLDGTNGVVIKGIDVGDNAGRAVSSAGDVNGDGVADILIGASHADPDSKAEAGEAYVVFGGGGAWSASLSLGDLDGTNGFVIKGVNAGDYAGTSVSSAGNINNDTVDDILIGAPAADSEKGKTYVVYGRTTTFGPTVDLSTLAAGEGFVIKGIDTDDRSGESVAAAGDVNDDDVDDLIIGAYDADPSGRTGAGESYVVYGNAAGFSSPLDLSGLTVSEGAVIEGAEAGDFSGFSVSSAGDVNHDDIDDVLIGAYGADQSSDTFVGETYVVYGRAGGFPAAGIDLSALTSTDGFVITGIDAGDVSGISVSAAGDVNGDDIDDLVIGARGNDSEPGESYVVFGREGGFSASVDLDALDGDDGFVIQGIDANDEAGSSVSSAGDVNGDGFADLLIGAHRADPDGKTDGGEAYVVFGSDEGFGASVNLSTLGGDDGFVINAGSANDHLGYSVSAAGDVNDDDVDDILIGAYNANPGSAAGAGETYVVFGDSAAPSVSASIASITNDSTPDVTVSVDDAGRSGEWDDRTVSLDVDLDNDGDFDSAGESAHTTGTVGAGTIALNTLTDGTYRVRATVIDLFGNKGLSSISTFTVDTTAPDAPSTPDLAAGSDTGDSRSDNETSDETPTLTGTAEAGATVTLSSSRDGTLGSVTADGEGGWTFTPTAALSEGTHNLTATARDEAGNESAASSRLSVTIDTSDPGRPSRPDLTSASDTGDSRTDNETDDTTPTLTGTAEANATVTLFSDVDGELGSVTADGSGDWTFTPDTALSEGTHALTATATDTAGNTSAESSALSVTIVTPATPVVTAVIEDTGADESDGVTADQTPTIKGTAEANATVEVFVDGESAGTTRANGAGEWSFAHTGDRVAAGTYEVTATATDRDGFVRTTASAFVVTIDPDAPAEPSAPDLSAGSDTGPSSSDNRTDDTTPTLTGTAEANATITVTSDLDGELGAVTATAAGTWRFTPDSPLSIGTHTLTVTVTDAAGNVSPVSSPLTVIIGDALPGVPVVTGVVDDTGADAADGVTADPTLVIQGTAEAGATVEVFIDGAAVGTTVADGAGAWAFDHTRTVLADGAHAVTATATDAAGITSAVSSALSVTVDSVAPAAPSAPNLLARSDTGPSDSDDYTGTATPILFGTAEAGALVTVSSDRDGPVGTATAGIAGRWVLTPDAALGDGPHVLTATASDLAGNVSVVSAALAVTIDTTAPAAPVVSGISDDTGRDGTDGVTADATLVIRGTAEAGATVAVFVDGARAGTTTADRAGIWVFDHTATVLAGGSHAVTATATDAAGNTSAASRPLSVTVGPTFADAPVIMPDALDAGALGFDALSVAGAGFDGDRERGGGGDDGLVSDPADGGASGATGGVAPDPAGLSLSGDRFEADGGRSGDADDAGDDADVGFGTTGSVGRDARLTITADLPTTLSVLSEGELSPTERVAVFEAVGADAIVSGLTGSDDPTAAAVGRVLSEVRRGLPLDMADLKRDLLEKGVDPETVMSYLSAFTVVEKAARTEALSGALADLALNPDAAGLVMPSDDVLAARRLPPETTHAALLIGIEAYDGPLRPLETPMADVEAVAEVLSERFGYLPVILTNPGKDEIVAWIASMVRQLEADSSLVIYYAGHGYAFDATGVGYWLPADARSDSASNWISTSELSSFLGKAQSDQILVISDSCFSGAFTKEGRVDAVSPDLIRGRAVTVMSSGGEAPVADDGFEGHSVFAGNLLQILARSDDGDLGQVIHQKVQSPVSQAVPQVPTYGALVSAGHQPGSDFVIGGR